MRHKLIIGLDLSSVDEARAIVARIGDAGDLLQDRLPARLCGRPRIRPGADGEGKKVFLDLKLHDIGNTVEEGVRSIARHRRDVPDGSRLSADHARGGGREEPGRP